MDLNALLAAVEAEPPDELPVAEKLPAEEFDGNKEYKWKLCGLTPQQIAHRTTQLHWRLNECPEGACSGGSEAFYFIGYMDDGQPRGISNDELRESLSAIWRMTSSLSCVVDSAAIRRGVHGKIAHVTVRRYDRAQANFDMLQVAAVGAAGVFALGRAAEKVSVLVHRHCYCHCHCHCYCYCYCYCCYCCLLQKPDWRYGVSL